LANVKAGLRVRLRLQVTPAALVRGLAEAIAVTARATKDLEKNMTMRDCLESRFTGEILEKSV
jgi:hypothetical protein